MSTLPSMAGIDMTWYAMHRYMHDMRELCLYSEPRETRKHIEEDEQDDDDKRDSTDA